MLAYYPLEHLYYFGSHDIYTISKKRLSSLALWSTRAWAVYVILQFLRIREDVAALETRGQALLTAMRKVRDGQVDDGDTTAVLVSEADIKAERRAITKQRSKLFLGFIGNLANVPLTIHWCVVLIYFSSAESNMHA